MHLSFSKNTHHSLQIYVLFLPAILDDDKSHLFFCQVIPFDNKGQLKEAFNIRYSI